MMVPYEVLGSVRQVPQKNVDGHQDQKYLGGVVCSFREDVQENVQLHPWTL